MHEVSEAGSDERWAAIGWTPRATRLLRALLWSLVWVLVLNGLQTVIPALQSSTAAPSCRGPRPCVAMVAPAPS